MTRLLVVDGPTPLPPTLFGRQQESATLARALRPGAVVVVTGPPGVGKTALVATAVAGDDGAVWVDLTGARSAADLWSALGRSVGTHLVDLADAPRRIGHALRAAGSRRVVLDPAELLPDDAWSEFEALVAVAPEITWVLASVVELPLSRAATLHVGPLTDADATALLLHLAQDRSLEDPPDPDDPSWSALARRLDGLPLALELAAARVPLLGPAELLARVDDARTLSGGRHASASGALLYAWALLGPDEQGDLAALSPLRGGFTLATAEEVLGPMALDRLDGLRSRSALVVRQRRFQVLEGLRRLARDAHPERASSAADTLVRWWAGRCDVWRAETRGARGAEASEALAAEQANLWAAWERARTSDPRAAASIAAGLLTSIHSSGPAWALDRLDGAEALAREIGGTLGAELLNRLAAVHLLHHRVEPCRPLLDDALRFALASGDQTAIAQTRCNLGLMHFTAGAYEEALAPLALACETPDPDLAALAWARLGALGMHRGDPERGAQAFEEAQRRIAAGAFPRLAGTVHLNLGIVRADQGRRTEAEACLERAVEETATHDEGTHAFAWLNLAWVRLAWSDPATALAPAEAAVAGFDALGVDVYRGYARVALAVARFAVGEPEVARALLAESARLTEPFDARSTALARLWRAAFDPELPLDEAVATARALDAHPALLEALGSFRDGGPSGPEPEQMPVNARIARRLARARRPELRAASSGHWFETPAGRVDLSRRGSLSRILAALIAEAQDRPGVGLGVDEVFEAGWPGQRALPDAAAARVYTAIRELRSLGLGDRLRRHADGYLLDPEAQVTVEGGPEGS